MKSLIKIVAIFGLLTFSVSCQIFSNEKKENLDLLPWPDMVGIPPEKSVTKWIKFDLVGTMNHPFSFVWFSSQKFEREYPNVLIKLEEVEYEVFTLFVRSHECEKNINNVHGDPLLRVTEYVNDHQTVRCIMAPAQACEYMTKLYAIPQIVWAEEQAKELQLTGNDLRCEFEDNKFNFVK